MPAVEVNRPDYRLATVLDHGRRQGFAVVTLVDAQVALHTEPQSDGNQRFPACKPAVAAREVPGLLVRIGLAQERRKAETENPVAEEFEPFERRPAFAARGARVGQRFLKQRTIGKTVTQRGFDLVQGVPPGQG